MRFLFRLFLLFVVVVALLWVFRAPILDRLGLVAGASARHAGSEAPGASGTAERTTRERLSDLDFSVDSIARELKATGRVVRRKAVQVGQGLEEATRDGRTTARIEARYALDPTLKARKIDVDTEDGRVTIRGQVETPDEVARAMRMALEEENVSEVTAALQVVPPGPGVTLTKDQLDRLPATGGPNPTPTPTPLP